MVIKIGKGAVESAPEVVERGKIDAKLFTEARKAAKAKKAVVQHTDAAAE
jgi:hypothetical protein